MKPDMCYDHLQMHHVSGKKTNTERECVRHLHAVERIINLKMIELYVAPDSPWKPLVLAEHGVTQSVCFFVGFAI